MPYQKTARVIIGISLALYRGGGRSAVADAVNDGKSTHARERVVGARERTHTQTHRRPVRARGAVRRNVFIQYDKIIRAPNPRAVCAPVLFVFRAQHAPRRCVLHSFACACDGDEARSRTEFMCLNSRTHLGSISVSFDLIPGVCRKYREIHRTRVRHIARVSKW